MRFGLMKGCEVVLEHIVFADEESLPEVVAGEPVHLQFMPTTLMLRGVGLPCMLTGSTRLDLPSVPRRGLFQLQPLTVYIRRRVEGAVPSWYAARTLRFCRLTPA